MSYQLFKAEILGNLTKPHTSKTKTANVITTAYTNLIMRSFETITGGGQFIQSPLRKLPLQIGIQTVLTLGLLKQNRFNFFNEIGPYFKSFWAGQTCLGTTGVIVITSPGIFQGPIIPESSNFTIWLDVFIGVIATHLLTLTGNYTNYYSGVTTPWSGALFMVLP